MQQITGHLEAYWEQGWEGRIAFAVAADDAEAYPHPLFLVNGWRLTIYDGPHVVWDGVIDQVRRRSWERHRLSAAVWCDTRQRGVRYADWIDWFWRRPPLRAVLHIPQPTGPAGHHLNG